MWGFGIGIIVGLAVAAILHGLFDDVSNYLRTKKDRRCGNTDGREERK